MRRVRARRNVASHVADAAVCQVVDHLTGGGQERVAVHLAEGLRPHVRESGLLATRGGGDYEAMIDSGGVKVMVAGRTARYDIPAWARSFNWIRRGGFSIVHTHNPGSLIAMTRLKRIPSVEFALVSHLQMLPPKGSNQRRLAIKWQQEAVHAVEAAIVTNEALRRHLIDECNYSSDSVFKLANPVDVDRWRQVDRKGGSLPESWTHDQRPLVAMVAQWRPQKDQHSAVLAMAELRNRGVDARLALVGEIEDSCADPVKVLIDELHLQDSVWIAGRRSDIPDILHLSDVGVLATLFEGSPVAVAEYAAAGLPVVVSDVDGTREIISPESGIIGVPPRAPTALADALEPLLRNSETRRHLGHAARVQITKTADEPVVIERLVSIYQSVLEKRSAVAGRQPV